MDHSQSLRTSTQNRHVLQHMPKKRSRLQLTIAQHHPPPPVEQQLRFTPEPTLPTQEPGRLPHAGSYVAPVKLITVAPEVQHCECCNPTLPTSLPNVPLSATPG